MNKTQVFRATLMVFLFGLSVLINLELMPVRRSQFKPGGDEIPFTWNPTLYRMMAFGHVPVATDLLLIEFLTSPEWKHVAEGKRAKAFYDLDLATELDPAFYSLYTAGAHFLTVVRNDNVGALKIIEKGENFRKNRLPAYPDSFQKEHWGLAWRIPFIKAFIEMFEVNNFPAAAVSLSTIDQFPEAPLHLKRLSTRLAHPVERYDVGRKILNGMLNASKLEREKEEIQKKIRNLEISRLVAVANFNFTNYLLKKFGKKFDQRALAQNTVERELADYAKKAGITLRDGVGGKFFVTMDNRIETTTKRDRVFGLE
jgi:hypothetical protein